MSPALYDHLVASFLPGLLDSILRSRFVLAI